MGKRFQFKQFVVEDFGCGMPVSTDGIMLGAWATAQTNSRILDIGTGTGLLSLMMAQRFPDTSITAVDIDATAVDAAQQNAAASPWSQRIQIQQQDITDWQTTTRFDTIVCNPPYFNSGEASTNSRRATARHTVTLSHQSLLNALSMLITPQGQAHLILPVYEAKALIEEAKDSGLHVSRLLEVAPTEAKPISRHLFTLVKNRPEKIDAQSLVIRQQGAYSEAFIALTRDFYLKM
ncbi:tRNA (adenosine(37)-N6)-methyltransferase TrmM [Veronia nyctiphanis]|uniref:tRNA1(Val) (adenine(37)-N6)-methyltransferase n=1 Tax=Veronia nyctiphanis TaxID=1278244 RepID=A0A4Q0YSV2_9GAMM|nr:methyltransferase [Veronia nyctiphanis]RXJ73775.1 tRNA (adenosine(37)-N6)-methyltransferase TrmM [Veronia nyctiphanis]